MAARHDALLVAQHDMTAMRSSRSEERQKLAVDPFDMRPLAVARSNRFLVKGVGDDGWRVVQQTARRERKGDFARPPILAGALDNLNQAQVGVARRRRVIGFIESKKRPAHCASRRQRRGIGLQGRACGLVLKARRRQARPERNS